MEHEEVGQQLRYIENDRLRVRKLMDKEKDKYTKISWGRYLQALYEAEISLKKNQSPSASCIRSTSAFTHGEVHFPKYRYITGSIINTVYESLAKKHGQKINVTLVGYLSRLSTVKLSNIIDSNESLWVLFDNHSALSPDPEPGHVFGVRIHPEGPLHVWDGNSDPLFARMKKVSSNITCLNRKELHSKIERGQLIKGHLRTLIIGFSNK